MSQGKVRKIVADKGFGFIQPDDGGSDLFFHHSSLVDLRIEDLGAGDVVSFDVQPGRDGKGPRAVNVARV
jgi:CspA family cold shock protein